MNILIKDIKSGATVYHGDNIFHARYMAQQYDSSHDGWEAELFIDGVKSSEDGIDGIIYVSPMSRKEAIAHLQDACHANDTFGDRLFCTQAPDEECTTEWAELNCPHYHQCQQIANADDLACYLAQSDGLRKALEYHSIFTIDASDEEPRKMTEAEFIEELRKECSAIEPDGITHMCNVMERPVTVCMFHGCPEEDFLHDSINYCECCPHIEQCSQEKTAYSLYLIAGVNREDNLLERAQLHNVKLTDVNEWTIQEDQYRKLLK